MGVEAALKGVQNEGAATGTPAVNDTLHARFVMWMEQSGHSQVVVAKKLNRSSAAVSQYVNKKYPGNLETLERDVLNLLEREEDARFAVGSKEFVRTEASRLIYEVLQYCDQKQKMGAAVAPSGTGKTETCKEYKRQNRFTIFITADITTKAPGHILRKIVHHIGGMNRKNSTSETLEAVIEKLRGSKRLIVIDDSHFLAWESFELIRKIHDCAGVGVTYVGQERLYDQMKGQEGRAYLFDQIYSRIAIKRDKFTVKKGDCKAMASTIIPSLDGECMDYLYGIAKGKGRFRKMTNLLEAAQEIGNQYGTPVDLKLLQEAEHLLMGDQ